MAKFSMKADSFLTPLKLILPGIIVSLVGASAAFFIFNNPSKIKAKQTFTSWKVIKEYEAAYSRSAEDAICASEDFNQIQFQKDLTHLLGVLIRNLEDLKNEENLDMRLQAFLNLKIDRYTDAKKLTEVFLDSVIKLNSAAEINPYDEKVKKDAQDLQVDFATEMEHVEARDTNELKRITYALNKEHIDYTKDSFILDLPRIQTASQVRQNFIGKWRFPEVKITIEFKKDKTGTWEESGQTHNLQWTMDDRTVTLYVDNQIFNFYLADVTSSKMTAVWKEKKFVLIGCRKSTP
jgi:hypothetical protein